MSADALVSGSAGAEPEEQAGQPATFDVLRALDISVADPQGVRLIERFQEWRYAASAHSVRAVYGDLSRFGAWARARGLTTVPAEPQTIKDYIAQLRDKGNRLSTIERALSSISLAHRLAGLFDPTKDEGVKWRMKGVRQELGAQRRIARPLRFRAGAVCVADILDLPNERLVDVRNKALISTAYDSGLRRAELVAIHTHQLGRVEEGHEIFVPRIKGSVDGYLAFITADTADLIAAWIRAAGIGNEIRGIDGQLLDNPLFRSVDRFDRVSANALHPDSVNRIFKSLVARAGRAKELGDEAIAEATRVSGHSTRVGSTQDLFANNVEIGPICLLRRWQDARMPLRYTRELAVQDNPGSEVLRRIRTGD